MSKYKEYTYQELMMVQVCYNHLGNVFWHDPVKLKRNPMIKPRHPLLDNLNSHQEYYKTAYSSAVLMYK